MSFIKIYPLEEVDTVADWHFGKGHPARCRPELSFEAREYWLNVAEIAAFEDCPLYLVTEADPNLLVDGIRLRLRSGEMLVMPDDAEREEHRFVHLVRRAARGELVEMEYSPSLRGLR